MLMTCEKLGLCLPQWRHFPRRLPSNHCCCSKLRICADLKEGANPLRVTSRTTAIDTSWPPHSLSRKSELFGEKAELLISRGAFFFFEGVSLQAGHTFVRQPRFYATVSFAAAGKHLELRLRRWARSYRGKLLTTLTLSLVRHRTK